MVYYYPCFRWRIRDRSRSGISQALKSILQSSTSTQPSFPRFLQAGFYVIGGSQSLRRRTSRLPLWQYPYEYFIRKCRTLQAVSRLFYFTAFYPAKTEERHCELFHEPLQVFQLAVYVRLRGGLHVTQNGRATCRLWHIRKIYYIFGIDAV